MSNLNNDQVIDADSVDADDVTVTNEMDANAVSASDLLTAPKYPTRADVPDQNGLYRVGDVDGEGNFGVIVREV